MATVTDSSLLSAAQQIVTEFMDKKASLNDGVIKKAGELGLNTDQTSRLIERTNTEAFLRLYPSDTEFDVASPEVILGIKTASVSNVTKVASIDLEDDGLFKAASVEKQAHNTINYYDRFSDEDIFGMDNDFFKIASAKGYEDAIDREAEDMMYQFVLSTKTASEQRQDRLIKEEAFDNAMETFGSMVKQASLRGECTVGDAEYEILNAFPGQEIMVRATFDALREKLASEYVNPALLTRSDEVPKYKYAAATPLTRQFERVIETARAL